MTPYALTAHTLTSALGAGLSATLAGLRGARTGLRPCDFPDVDLTTWIGRVDGLEAHALTGAMAAYECRNNRLADLALRQDGFEAAIDAARERYGAHRIGVFLGTSSAGILETEQAYRARDSVTGALPASFNFDGAHSVYSLGAFVQARLGLRGPGMVVSTACSSSAKVFGNAVRMIEAGFCDAALVGGVDTLCLTTLYGFNSLGLVSAKPCRPFDAERDGISIGEGAAFVLLESAHAAPHAPRLLGVGESSDAHHMSSPHPEGVGARLAIEAALRAAALTPAQIDYINLHGTATRSNDASEDKGVAAVFGNATPCSSTKGATGHLLGAAGAAEAVIALLALEHGFMPGGLNTCQLDPELRSRYLCANTEAALDHVLSNSFGFGGSNCSLIFGRALP